MKQYYLVNRHVNGHPTNVALATDYVSKIVDKDRWLLTPLNQIIVTLSNLRLNEDGEIAGLTRRISKDGMQYYCIVSKNYPLPNGNTTSYEILKKINSKDHVYEIRLKLKKEYSTYNYRIFVTINMHIPYFVWTYGFTKRKELWRYSNDMTANELTDQLALVTHRVFNGINSGNEDKYIGKVGERDEVC